MGERRGAYEILTGKPDKVATVRLRHRWEDNNKMYLFKIVCRDNTIGEGMSTGLIQLRIAISTGFF